jgi:uncharacterized membrane protein YkvA (DUF1232 family)
MSALAWAVLSICAIGLSAGGLLVWTWRRAGDDSRYLVRSIWRLRLRDKLRLARSLAGDRRIPLLVRLLPPALVLYLAMPFDIVPDFVPVLGQLDDLLIAAAGAVLLLRLTPREVLEEKLARLGVPER